MTIANPFPNLSRLGLHIIVYIFLLAQFSFAQPQPQRAEGIENFFKLNDKIYSGSSPENENAFAALQKLGIKTVISVDGAKPDVEAAKKFGMRYVHLPFGYDGVPTNQSLMLVKAARVLPKPIYVHCHHGVHRGPAGAAVICEGTENWTASQAVAWLKQAGTATNYTGLYKSVENFQAPSNLELEKVPAHFPEITEASPLVDAMVEIDLRFDNLKLGCKAGFLKTPAHPDLRPEHEALLLEELFKELNRSPETQKRGADLQNKMMAAEKAAGELRTALKSKQTDRLGTKLSEAFDKMANSCAGCHKRHRN